MNVNELSGQLLDEYRRLGQWPDGGNLAERLAEIHLRVSVALESFRATQKYGMPLIHDTCAISREDCKYWDKCVMEKEGEMCEPEGLAFRLADIVMVTLAAMAELGIDMDAVITAEHRYLRNKETED